MEKFNQNIENNIEDIKNKEILDIEMDILDRTPFETIRKLFGDETYLIGGAIRDIIFKKNHLGDLDLMTRISKQEIKEALESNGYQRSEDSKFSSRHYSIKDDIGVYNF